MVMVVVKMAAGMVVLHMALSCIAGLTLRLKFKRRVHDSMLFQFLPNQRL